MMNRRRFLRRTGVGLGSLVLMDPLLSTIASTYGQTNQGTRNLLVLCQLEGGLDCLSLLAPHTNVTYRRLRPATRLTAEDVLPLPDAPEYGLHGAMPFFSNLYGAGDLAIVQQVGYPDANGSHFESREIYEYGVRNLGSKLGTNATWYERLRRSYFDQPYGVLDVEKVGDPSRYGYPDSTYRLAAQDAFGRLGQRESEGTSSQRAMREAFVRVDERSAALRERAGAFESVGESRGSFHRAAALASADLGTQILKVQYGGFDTHGGQGETLQRRLAGLDTEFSQFVEDLRAMGMWERTAVCFYSEFGRRNEENGSAGTDHGHGGHMVLAGPAVRGGLHGQRVTTADLQEGSLPYYVDFRAVLGACVGDWLGFDARPIFQIEGETYDENVGSDLFA